MAIVEEHEIPPGLIMNLDQTSKIHACIAFLLWPRNEPSQCQLQVAQIRDVLSGGKTAQILPRFKFPESFSLSVNPMHFSNTEESIKIINEVVLPYVDKQREKLGNHGQVALLILDVFRRQITQEVTTFHRENNILFVTVPNNMIHFFQPLDLTVNGHCNSFMKNFFCRIVCPTI